MWQNFSLEQKATTIGVFLEYYKRLFDNSILKDHFFQVAIKGDLDKVKRCISLTIGTLKVPDNICRNATISKSIWDNMGRDKQEIIFHNLNLFHETTNGNVNLRMASMQAITKLLLNELKFKYGGHNENGFYL